MCSSAAARPTPAWGTLRQPAARAPRCSARKRTGCCWPYQPGRDRTRRSGHSARLREPAGTQGVLGMTMRKAPIRHALPLWAALVAALWPAGSFAYRPFDATDAAVADLGELEIEWGPAEFRRSAGETTLIAPAYVFNYGFAKDWELVLEGQA